MSSAGWNTIESDAGVFTYLIEKLGVKDVQFEELVALDEYALRDLAPVYGVIFLFKYPTGDAGGAGGGGGAASQPQDGTYDYAAAETLFFANQVIQNACGTQALLSVLLNKDGSGGGGGGDDIDIGPTLRDFKDFTSTLPPEFRGECLSNSEQIRSAHNSFARSSPFVDETQRAATEDDDVYHFVAYTPVGGALYELDGLHPAPISHGPCAPDAFPAAVIPVLQRRIARYPATEIRFNLLAMTRDLRLAARERGDPLAEEREEARRREWGWENALRRHNFLGFAKEVLAGVVGMKLREGGGRYEEWVEAAKGETRRRMQARRGAGGGAAAESEMEVDA